MYSSQGKFTEGGASKSNIRIECTTPSVFRPRECVYAARGMKNLLGLAWAVSPLLEISYASLCFNFPLRRLVEMSRREQNMNLGMNVERAVPPLQKHPHDVARRYRPATIIPAYSRRLRIKCKISQYGTPSFLFQRITCSSHQQYGHEP